jgi:hypothetical protein
MPLFSFTRTVWRWGWDDKKKRKKERKGMRRRG